MLSNRFKHIGVIFSFCVFCCGHTFIFAQTEINSGEQATTFKTPSINFKDATYQPTPLWTITKDQEELLMAGVYIAADYNPYTKGAKTAIKLGRFALDVANESVDVRNRVVESDLILIDNKASRLKEIAESEGGISNNLEAEQLYNELKERSKEVDGSGSFFLKAISSNSLYSVLKQGGYLLLKEFIGKRITKLLGENRVSGKVFFKLNQIGLGRKSFNVSRTKWQQLKKLGDLAEDISKKMIVSLNKYIIIKGLKKFEKENKFSMFLDSLYTKIMGHHPPTYSVTSSDMRVMASVAPQVVLTIFAEIPARYLTVAMPVQVAAYHDPVCNTTSVQNHIIASQHSEQNSNYDVRKGNSTPVNYPISSSHEMSMPSWAVPTGIALGHQ